MKTMQATAGHVFSDATDQCIKCGISAEDDAITGEPCVDPPPVNLRELDEFTRAYLQTALWSSTGHRYGECPCCGRLAVLDRWPEACYEREAVCPNCGISEAEPEPLDGFCGPEDIAPDTLAQMVKDCAFVLQRSQATPEYLACALAGGWTSPGAAARRAREVLKGGRQ